MPTRSSATPLLAVDAVVLDTETTGLDTSRARMVQVGAVRVRGGRVNPAQKIDLLINPGVPIPPASTKIHHIDTDMVAGAADFAEAFGRVRAFVEDAVVIGHSIGFDLAVFKREVGLAGLEWAPWRSLDIRMLAQIANPKLPGYSLEQLADWLGVDVRGRHSAIGDALVTAQIFVALIGPLRERGTRTLAQAEQACRALTSVLEQDYRAGWVEPIAAPAVADARSTFAQIDSYAYRHRVGDVMSHPPLIGCAQHTIGAIVGSMEREKVSSLFLRPRDGPLPDRIAVDEMGIVTERDILRAIARHGTDTMAWPVARIMSKPLVTISADAYIYRAMGRMSAREIRHLAVVDEDGALIGAISARDLLRLRAGEAIALGDEIDAAGDIHELATAWAKLPMVVRGLVHEEVDPRTTAGVISREIGALSRQAAVIGERRMAAAGKGQPPVPYALLILGSAGRGESLLAADQDNAIIFQSGDPDGPEDVWFAELGGHIADILHQVGVPYCDGGVMARNGDWRGSPSTWNRRIEGWLRRSLPRDLLQVDIFFDMRAVHGDAALAQSLMSRAYQLGHNSPIFAKLLAEQLFDYRVPIGLLGGFKLTDGRLDLKMGGLFPIVAGARVLAIAHNIPRRATLDRLSGIRDLKIGGDSDLEHMISAHQVILRHILRQQLQDLMAGRTIVNAISVTKLSKLESDQLHDALSGLSHVGDMVRDLLFR
jgi:CBS domain-containing protein